MLTQLNPRWGFNSTRDKRGREKSCRTHTKNQHIKSFQMMRNHAMFIFVKKKDPKQTLCKWWRCKGQSYYENNICSLEKRQKKVVVWQKTTYVLWKKGKKKLWFAVLDLFFRSFSSFFLRGMTSLEATMHILKSFFYFQLCIGVGVMKTWILHWKLL